MDEKEKHIIPLLNNQDQQAISLLYDDFAPTLYRVVLRKFFEEQSTVVLWIITPWLSNGLGSFLLV